MYRCYACKTPFTESVRESTTTIGLCEHCQRRTNIVKQHLSTIEPATFGEAYFQQEDIDEPICLPHRRCQRCGLVGSTFNWNHWWVEDISNASNDPPQAMGDGYSYCQNCATLSVTPWSETSIMLPTTPTGIAQPPPLATGTTDWLLEAILLLVLSVAIVISFL